MMDDDIPTTGSVSDQADEVTAVKDQVLLRTRNGMAAERFVGGISPNIAAVDTRKLVANATISSWHSSLVECTD
jgi:hypothetical protein